MAYVREYPYKIWPYLVLYFRYVNGPLLFQVVPKLVETQNIPKSSVLLVILNEATIGSVEYPMCSKCPFKFSQWWQVSHYYRLLSIVWDTYHLNSNNTMFLGFLYVISYRILSNCYPILCRFYVHSPQPFDSIRHPGTVSRPFSGARWTRRSFLELSWLWVKSQCPGARIKFGAIHS